MREWMIGASVEKVTNHNPLRHALIIKECLMSAITG